MSVSSCSRRLARTACVLAGIARLATDGSAQSHRPHERNPLGDQLGMSLASLGDVNSDGKCDLIAGALRAAPDQPGYAVVISGANGAILRVVHGAIPNDHFGISVGGGRDTNGDGVGDFAVGAINWRSRAEGVTNGYVRVFSGSDGALLFHAAAPTDSELFGRAVALIPDVNSDGRAEIAVAAPALDFSGDGRLGELIVLSGGDGSVLYRVAGESRKDEFATAIASIQDQDGDQIADLLVGAPGFGNLEESGGYVRVVSGANGNTIFTLRGNMPAGGFGACLTSGVDLDGDSIGDFVVSSRRGDRKPTNGIQLFSGATRQLIAGGESPSTSFGSAASVAVLRTTVITPKNRILFADPQADAAHIWSKSVESKSVAVELTLSHPEGGLNLCQLGDIDFDGVDDFAVGCPWATPPNEPSGPSIGEIVLVSGANWNVLCRVRGGIHGM